MTKHPHLAGTLLSIGSAFFYTVTHVCLRHVANDTEPAMTCEIRGLVSMLALLPWFLWRTYTGRCPLPSVRLLILLIAIFTFVQVGGNLSIQYAMASVGLAITIPVVYGTQLIASALLGRILLSERVPPLSIFAIGVTITSVMILSTGVKGHAEVTSDAGPQSVSYLIGFLAACLTGLAYTAMSLTIRATVFRSSDPSKSLDPLTIVFLNAVVATFVMTPLTFQRIGLEGVMNIKSDQLFAMFGVGIGNLAALSCYSLAMRFIKVVHANVINASQIAGCYLAGILVFSEIISPTLFFGVLLTIIGVLCVGFKPYKPLKKPFL